MEVLCPQTSLISSFSLLQNCYFLNFNHWKYGFYVNVGKSMLLNEVVYLRCLLQIYAPTFFKSWLYQPKKASASGDCVPKTPTKFYTSFTSYNHYWFVHECEQSSTSLEPCYLFQIFASNMHQNEWFSSLIFQKISGEEHRAPSPNPFSRFRSGFALSSGSALNSWALRTLYSGFALDYRALRSLDSGFTLNFQFAKLVWPQNIFLYPPVLVCALFGEFLDRLLIINYTDSL